MKYLILAVLIVFGIWFADQMTEKKPNSSIRYIPKSTNLELGDPKKVKSETIKKEEN